MQGIENTSRRAVIYARQSVDVEQGINQQLDRCRAKARELGLTVVAEFTDNDVSGSKDRGDSTAWAKMLRSYDEGVFDIIVVNDVDRLTRRLIDIVEIRPPRRNIRVIVARGDIDTADPTGDFVFAQLVLLAEREIKVKQQRHQAYAVERRKKGHPSPGHPTYGYRWVPAIERDAEGTRYAVVPEEAEIVRRVFAEFHAGASMRQIAADLRSDGVPTANGGQWHSSSVRRIVMNPVYAGLLPASQPSGKHDIRHSDISTSIPGAWEPIVSVDEVILAREKLLAHPPRHDGNARKWLLGGYAVCGRCGSVVRSARAAKHAYVRRDGVALPERYYHSYRCPECSLQRRGNDLDDLVGRIIVERLARPDAAELLVPQDDEVDVLALSRHRDALTARQADVVRLVASGKVPLAAAESSLDEILKEIEQVEAQIAAATASNPLADVITTADTQRWWDEATLGRRRAVMELLLTPVILPVGKGYRPSAARPIESTIEIVWKA